MEKKIVYKIFTIADYDREAAYFKKNVFVNFIHFDRSS